MQSGKSHQPLLIAGRSELGREVSLESMYLISNSLWGDNFLCFIQDGVIIAKERFSPESGEVAGAVAFIDATDIQTDQSGLRITGDISAQLRAAKLEWDALCGLALKVFKSESLPPVPGGAAKILESDVAMYIAGSTFLATLTALSSEALPAWVALPALVIERSLVKFHRQRGGLDWRESRRLRLECIVRKSCHSL